MEAITCKDLSIYLPYSLKVKLKKRDEIFNVAYMSTKRIALVSTMGFGEVVKVKWEYFHRRYVPILRSPDQLTPKELEEWFSLENMVQDSLEIIRVYYKNTYQILWDLKYKDKRQDLNLKDGFSYVCLGLSLKSKHKKEKLEWLYSKHIDVNNLIEKDLAFKMLKKPTD